MRLSVHHATRFKFDQPSGHSIHDVRLTPKPATGQRIVSWRIEGPGKRSEWLDGHNNQVTTFSVAQQHDAVEIVVHGVYEYSGADHWNVAFSPHTDQLDRVIAAGAVYVVRRGLYSR